MLKTTRRDELGLAWSWSI